MISTVQGINNYSNIIPSKNCLDDFHSCLKNIVDQSQDLTKSYQDEISKWVSKQYDNSTLISITDLFIPKFENLITNAQNMEYPQYYKYVHEALVNSLKSETDSYKHFRNYLSSGNITEDEISTDLLSLAFQYEQIYSSFLTNPHANIESTTLLVYSIMISNRP